MRLKGRSAASRARKQAITVAIGRFILPALLMGILATVLIVMGYMWYGTATSSDFFSLRSVEVSGTERTPVEDIKRIVTASAEKPGVWNADLGDIRAKIEKFPFVKSAAVSRMLPGGIRVNITERVPAAVVQLNSGKYLVDSEGMLLAAVKTEEKDFPFVMHGWDESKTETAIPENVARLKVYRKMLDEWGQFDLASRVKEVKITNPRQPIAVVVDSGREVDIVLARDSLGKSLKTAIEALSGKGAKVKSIDAGGVYPVINYLEF